MEREDDQNVQDSQEMNKLIELIEGVKFCSEMDFSSFANLLEDWIAKIQNVVGLSKPLNVNSVQKSIHELLSISSSFMDLLNLLDQVKITTMTCANNLLESFNELLNKKVVVNEVPKHLDSHKIKLDFVRHDFEIGGLIHGIVDIPHQHYFITGHNTGYVNIWGKSSLQIVNHFKAHDSPITVMTYLEKEKLLFTGSLEGKVKVFKAYNFSTLKALKTFYFEKKKIFGLLHLEEENVLLIACKEGFIHVVNVENFQIIKTIRKHGPLDHSMVYIPEIKAIAIGCLGNDTVEIICPRTFMTKEIIHKKFMVQMLKNIQWNSTRKELLVSFAYKIIKIFKFDENNKAIEDRELSVDKPFPSKIDFIDENSMVFASLSDKLDFIKTKDGQPIKSIQLGFTFSDFLLLKDERKIIVFPYQSSESSIGVIEY